MDQLTQAYLDEIMQSIKDLCDVVGFQAADGVKSRMTDLMTDLANGDSPRDP